MNDLFLELQVLLNQLNKANQVLAENGKKYAESEYEYKVALNQCALRMKAEGMAIGLITLTCYGDKDVATKRLQRDICKTTYDSNIEFINSLKLQIKVKENALDREYRG